MVRAVSRGFYGGASIPPTSMPIFRRQEAEKAYFTVHTNRPSFNDAHTGSRSSKLGVQCVHQPRHDAESIYWVIVAFLFRSIPISPTEETENKIRTYSKFYATLLNHHADYGPFLPDERVAFLELTDPIGWSFYLHNDFENISGMMASLTALIAPEYESLANDLPQDHLHEGMQRILLDQIMEMDESGNHLEISASERKYITPEGPQPGAGATQSYPTSSIPSSRSNTSNQSHKHDR